MVSRISLRTPLGEDEVRRLRAGDLVSLSGIIVTGRDRVHKYLAEERPPVEELPVDLTGTVLYHCGPVMREEEGIFRAVAAGPTTSMRMEMYTPEVIMRYGIRGIMGKGGMGRGTLRALGESGCVYLNTIGGGAVYLADRIVRTVGVWKLQEFGPAEALWVLEVRDFPAVVTMDTGGKDLHEELQRSSAERFAALTGTNR